MANSPPDIVLGVALAADPQKYRVAAERLRRLAEVAAGVNVEPGTFSTSVEAARAGAAESPAAIPAGSTPSGTAPRQPRSTADAFGQLEAFVLQTFIQSMLPKNAQHVFGKGTAGEIWKSMLAEKLGGEIARSGQIGIAKRLASGRVELAANRIMAPGTGLITAALSPSASVANAFMARQAAPRQADEAAESVAPPPVASPERG